MFFDKIEEMKICQEGDVNFIGELKRQLEEELVDKEVKWVEVEEIMVSKEVMFNK